VEINKALIIRGFKYCAVALAFYFGAKAPIMWLFTSVLGVNYIVSGAIAGILVTLLTFFLAETWIFKDIKDAVKKFEEGSGSAKKPKVQRGISFKQAFERLFEIDTIVEVYDEGKKDGEN
jgi:hypothetical protein